MTQCTSKSKEYIDYNCYDCLNYKFYRSEVAHDAKPYLTQALNSTFLNIPKSSDIKKLLEWILEHLTCNRAFWYADTNIPCKYINYWLNEKVQRLYPYEYDSKFGKFEEFVKNFYTEVKSYDSYKSCANNIQLLKGDEYKKLNTLYALYKKYDELKNINQWEYEKKKTCEIIQEITNLANDIARSYKNDDEFIKVLKILRDTIKNGEGRYKKLCDSDLNKLDNMVTETAFPPKVHIPPTGQEISKPSGSLEQPTHQALAQVSEKGIRNSPEQIVDFQASSSTEQLTSEEHLTKVSRAKTPPEASPLLEIPFSSQHPGVSHHGSSHSPGSLHDDLLISESFPREPSELSRDAHSRSAYTRYNSVDEVIRTEDVITRTDGAQSYLENIKGTITGVFQSVEPAPILGVSGGMGALFLLFKYTPVGSFFGGRRLRARRIPSGFSGQFLGTFPDIQDYDGRHIGYGPMNINPLAE